MATNINESSLLTLKNTVEPSPSDDDDESFVVLGKHLEEFEYEHLLDKDFPDNIDPNVVRDFHQSLQKELDNLENNIVTNIPENMEKGSSLKNDVQSMTSSVSPPITSNTPHQSLQKELDNLKNNMVGNMAGNMGKSSWFFNDIPRMTSSVSPITSNTPHQSLQKELDNLKNNMVANIPEGMEKGTSLKNDVQSMTSSVSSITSNTPENLQNKIDQLIKEKENLQQTIVRNNEIMKKHFDTIGEWKRQVQNVHESNKEKLIEAKQIYESLRADNVVLVQKIKKLSEQLNLNQEESKEESFKTIIEQQKNEIQSLNIEKLQIQDELTVAKQELAYLNTKLANQQKVEETTNLEANKIEELERIIAKLYVEKEFAEKENSSLKEKLKESEAKTNDLENKLKEIELKFQEVEKIRTNAVKENNDLREEIVSLKENLTSSTEMELEISQLVNAKEDLLKQIEKLKDDRAKVEATAIQNEIQMKAHMEKLQNDIQNALAGRVQTTEELEQVRLQLMNAQAKIAHLEEQISQQKNEIAQKERDLAVKNDNYFALETQLDLYKNDFEAERVARQNVQSEKDQLVNDMQQLQRRNQQLQEEIEMLRERGFVYVSPQNDGHARGQPSAPSAPGNGDNSFKCPMCNFGFRDYQALENHVHRCIDLEQLLP